MSRIARFYGAQPLHVLASIVSFAIVAAGVAGWFQAGSDPRGIIAWVLGSAIGFEWIMLPLAWALDWIAVRPGRRRGPRGAGAAYVRVPLALSGLLLIVFSPLILRADSQTFTATTGLAPPDYLARWLLASAALFACSALRYALSLRRAAQEPASD